MIQIYKTVSCVSLCLLLLLLIPISRSFLQTYRQVQLLQTVDNPGIFIKQFDTFSSEPVKIPLRCSPFALLTCINNEYYVSPYWPYLKVKETLVEEGNCGLRLSAKNSGPDEGYRTRLEDRFWRVFWIGVDNCGLHKVLYYGPYRLH